VQTKSVIETIKEYYEQMFSAEKKVADFILTNPEKAVQTNVSELADLSDVSDATVIRMCKHIGYQGYYQMKINLSHDLGRNALIQKQKENQPSTIKGLFDLFTYNFMNIANNLNAQTLVECARIIRDSNVVHIAAAGNTAPVASDLGFRLGRFGIRTTHSMVAEYFLNYVSLANEGDAVLAISKSGSSRQVLQALELAKQKNLKTILMTAFECSPMSKLADHLLLTKCENELFGERGPDSHLNEMAMSDVLLYFVLHGEAVSKKVSEIDLENIDAVELILSEYKV